MAAIVPINGQGFQIGEGGKRRRNRKGYYDVTLSECYPIGDLSMVVSISRFGGVRSCERIRTQRRATRINLSTNATIQGENKISNMTRYTKND